jgi:hypothetical protein
MAKTYWEVTDLEGVQRPDTGLFDLFATLDGPGGQVRLQVAPEALLYYAEFQRAVLCGAGVVYRYVGSEGRPPLAADESWRAVTATMLRATAAPHLHNPN